MIRLLLLLGTLLPFHGVVMAPLGNGQAIVRGDAITLTVPAKTRRFRLTPAISLRPGTGVDAFLDRSTTPWTLRDPVAAPAFAAGLPQVGKVIAVDIGKPLPRATLIDQDGRLVQLATAFRGKTALISFIYSRCPDTDVCIAISTKYAQLQHELDPAHFALVEITLDPPYDSPAVLNAYGKRLGRDSGVWSLLTGTGSTIERVLDEFQISSLQTDSATYVHSDRLYMVTPHGKVAYVIDTAEWDPRTVVAEARQIDGMSSNPFERFKLSLIASVVAFCGGSQYAGVVLLETALFILITIVVTIALIIIGRVIWSRAA
ncbi:MAG TPA: SCO family protein [Candidatus Baltobacteraceae bacterium]|nr:SCO family protein [Candidatus Baltobacteraceae bacterium]